MLDWTRIEMLREDFGAEDFTEVVDLFTEETRPVIGGLDRSADIAADLHFIKGGAENMGFRNLAELCRRGEYATGRGDAVDCGEISRCFDASLAELAAGQTRNSDSVASSVMSR